MPGSGRILRIGLLLIIFIAMYFTLYRKRQLKNVKTLNLTLAIVLLGSLSTLFFTLNNELHLGITTAITYCALSLLNGTIFGLLRGLTNKISYNTKKDYWYVQGNTWTLSIFVIGVLCSQAIAVLFHGIPKIYESSEKATTITITTILIHIATAHFSSKPIDFYKKRTASKNLNSDPQN
ncbi:MAG: hypothetical protein QM613_00095 [Micrococcaceae bacterium]